MSAALLAIAAVAAAVLAFTVATREPSELASVALVIGSAAVVAGALSARVLLWLGARSGPRRGKRTTLRALRRGFAIGAACGVLAFLRVVDGLTLVTAAFVVLAFALAEVALSARTTPVR
jgi:hypothetical protein